MPTASPALSPGGEIVAEINHNEKATYESPRAMRLQGPPEGLGVCVDGSGDASCVQPGNAPSGGDCVTDGVSALAGDCFVNGYTAIGSCDTQGSAAGAACLQPGAGVQ
jgi:hypothetical protein